MNSNYYNDMVVERCRDRYLDPDNYFFENQSNISDYEEEKEEFEYELSNREVEWLKKECESDDFEHLGKYEWAEILEELTGERIRTEDIVNIDLATNTITYLK